MKKCINLPFLISSTLLLINSYIISVCNQVHLFDVNIPGGIRFQESEVLSPGSKCTIFDAGVKVEKRKERDRVCKLVSRCLLMIERACGKHYGVLAIARQSSIILLIWFIVPAVQGCARWVWAFATTCASTSFLAFAAIMYEQLSGNA